MGCLQKPPKPSHTSQFTLFTHFLNIKKVLRKTEGQYSTLIYSQLIYILFEE